MTMNETRSLKGPSWLAASLAYCCSPVQAYFDDSDDDEPRRRGVNERTIDVLRDQPVLEPPPVTEAPRTAWPGTASAAARERTMRKSFSSGRTSFSVRKRFLSNASSRRPQISAPSDFRHIHSETFRFPNHPPQGRPPSFQPLQLNQLSPMLAHFDFADIDVALASPPAAVTYPARDDESFALKHERSYSSLSFHVPRRPTTGHSSSLRQPSSDDSLPRPPPKARTRAYTSASVEGLLERIAQAMIEKERIQSQIDDVVERQSIYISSRPTTAYGEPADYEPPLPVMPNIPAVPPVAPSFAERLGSAAAAAAAATAPTAAAGPSSSSIQGATPTSSQTHQEQLQVRLQQHQQQQQQMVDRPATAPPGRQPVHIPSRLKPFNEAVATFHNPRSPPPRRDTDRTPPPPLPLVLRPPLRKKKSFSRVSSWLFQPIAPGSSGVGMLEQQHQRTGSAGAAGSITNAPRPLSGSEGFYQTIGGAGDDSKDNSPVDLRTPPHHLHYQQRNHQRGPSVDTVSTLSSWDSELDRTTDDYDEEKATQRSEDHTVPTSAWSPAGSSPATRTKLDDHQVPSPATDLGSADADIPPPTPPKDKGLFAVKGPRPQSVGVAF